MSLKNLLFIKFILYLINIKKKIKKLKNDKLIKNIFYLIIMLFLNKKHTYYFFILLKIFYEKYFT